MVESDEVHGPALELARMLTRPATRSWLQGGHLQAFSVSDTWLLLHLWGQGPLTMSELAHWQQVNRSTMTVQVLHLERRGLLERTPDAGDHRLVVVRLTGTGRAAARGLDDGAAQAFAQTMAGWTDSERAVLADLLGRLTRDLDAARDQHRSEQTL